MAKSFSEITEYNSENLLIVDALNLCFRWKHKGVNQFTEDYISTVKSLARSYKCGTIVMAADWGSSSYRKQLFSGYKQNREELRAEQTQKEKDDFELFFAEYERTLDVMEKEGHLVLKFRRVEADDIAAYIVKYKKNFKINKIWLASSDRDWDLLVSDNVSRFSYVTRKETTVDNWREHYDFPREEYITFKCLTGDKGDNIPGIYGIGPKRATKVMETYGSVFDIYSSCPINEKYKYIQELNANAEQLLTNVELMDLITYCDEAIGYENCLELRDKLGDYI